MPWRRRWRPAWRPVTGQGQGGRSRARLGCRLQRLGLGAGHRAGTSCSPRRRPSRLRAVGAVRPACRRHERPGGSSGWGWPGWPVERPRRRPGWRGDGGAGTASGEGGGPAGGLTSAGRVSLGSSTSSAVITREPLADDRLAVLVGDRVRAEADDQDLVARDQPFAAAPRRDRSRGSGSGRSWSRSSEPFPIPAARGRPGGLAAWHSPRVRGVVGGQHAAAISAPAMPFESRRPRYGRVPRPGTRESRRERFRRGRAEQGLAGSDACLGAARASTEDAWRRREKSRSGVTEWTSVSSITSWTRTP